MSRDKHNSEACALKYLTIIERQRGNSEERERRERVSGGSRDTEREKKKREMGERRR